MNYQLPCSVDSLNPKDNVLKFAPLTWLVSPTILRRPFIWAVVMGLLLFAVYKVSYHLGNADGVATTRHQFSMNIRAAAERESKMVEDSVYNGRVLIPIKPGKYTYEIRSYNDSGYSFRDLVDSSVVTISMDINGYSIASTSHHSAQLISTDGLIFAWEDNRSDDGYAQNYNFGRAENGVVRGRIFHIHFNDTGVKHFTLTPIKAPSKISAGNNPPPLPSQ